jgi:hypothetical protein
MSGDLLKAAVETAELSRRLSALSIELVREGKAKIGITHAAVARSREILAKRVDASRPGGTRSFGK